MKILFCSESSKHGGAGTYANQMQEIYTDLHICTDSLSSAQNKILRYFLAISVLFKILKKENVEYIIFQSSYGLLCSIIIRILIPKIKIINVYHGLVSNYQSKLVWFIEKCSAIVANKLVVINLTDGDKLGFPYKQSYIPNCAINTNFFPAADPLGALVTVTRHSRQKNNNLLKKFTKISSRKITVYAPIAQHPYFKSELLSDLVTISFSDNKDKIYSGKAIFILSTYSEGFPLSILEAANFGLPIVVSDIPVLKALLQENALYFKSSEELCEITERLLNNARYFEDRVRASRRISEEFSYEVWCERWRGLMPAIE